MDIAMNELEDAGPILLKLGNEVRHTLHHMMGLLDLAEEEALTQVRSRYLSMCRRTAEQLLWMSNDVSELTLEHPAPGEAPFHFAEMVNEVVALVRPVALRKGLSFDCWIDPRVPPTIVGDRDLIQSAFRRVLENGVSLTTHGGIAGLIQVSAANADSAVIDFKIRDTRSHALALADPADELESVAATPQALGLLIARKLAILLGGSLTLANSDRGTTVRLSLPVKIAAPEMDCEKHPDTRCRVFPLRLLVAEDSNDSFALFQLYVLDEGHVVSRALDGAQAVEMVKKGAYDMVVMDVDMPGMDGYAATRSIREWEALNARPRLPILLLSADPATRQRGLGAAAGCSGYLTKPARKNVILEALRNYGRRGSI
jgi:CheY-like chemotaxis protein